MAARPGHVSSRRARQPSNPEGGPRRRGHPRSRSASLRSRGQAGCRRRPRLRRSTQRLRSRVRRSRLRWTARVDAATTRLSGSRRSPIPPRPRSRWRVSATGLARHGSAPRRRHRNPPRSGGSLATGSGGGLLQGRALRATLCPHRVVPPCESRATVRSYRTQRPTPQFIHTDMAPFCVKTRWEGGLRLGLGGSGK